MFFSHNKSTTGQEGYLNAADPFAVGGAAGDGESGGGLEPLEWSRDGGGGRRRHVAITEGAMCTVLPPSS